MELLQTSVETAKGSNQDQKDALPAEPQAYNKPF